MSGDIVSRPVLYPRPVWSHLPLVTVMPMVFFGDAREIFSVSFMNFHSLLADHIHENG